MSANDSSVSSRLWDTVRREPLVHFLGLAALLFAVQAVFFDDGKEVITIDYATQEFLIKQQEDLLLRPLTEEEKAEAVESFIEDEILVREARRKGLGNSSRIRRLLIQNMRFFAASELPQPSDDDLRAWFDANIERFESAPAITYDHVFFAEPESVPADILDRLAKTSDPSTLSDSNIFGSKLIKMDQPMIARSFGPEEAPKVLAIKEAGWHGPFNTPQGTHFLRIAEHHPPSRPDFEQARKWLEQDWMVSKQREIMDQELSKLRQNYRTEILGPGGANE